MEIKEHEFIQIVNYVKLHFGIDLSQKKSLIHSRLENYLIKNNYTSFSEFYSHIVSDKTGMVASILIDKLSTNHTFFFREIEHFNYLKDSVLPSLKQSEKFEKDLRIWSAGCSSGEEAYTISMIVNEFLNSEKQMWDTKMLATDISENALNKAKIAIYTEQQLVNISNYLKTKYFEKISEDKYSLKKCIRDEVIFRRFNFMNKQFPFKKKFHCIFCRNVMIYFDEPTKDKLVNKFYEMTEPGGYLFIGHSEFINKDSTKYKYISPSIYRKEK